MGRPLRTLPGLVHSFRNAGRGVMRTVSTQRNMRIHTVSATMVMILGMTLPFDLASRTALLFCVALVFFAEILNTALESFVDLHVRSFHRHAMIAKDAAAAGVLVLAVATVTILAAILYMEWGTVMANSAAIVRSAAFGLPIVILVVTLLWWARRTWLRALLFAAAAALALPLWAGSEDPVFSTCLGGLLLLSALARPGPEIGDDYRATRQ